MYDQARKHLGTDGLNEILASLYKEVKPAPWHEAIPKLFWYRIYTTNVDDVIENSYRARPVQKLNIITCPYPYQDQDIWYDHTQCVHLHGSVLDFSKGFTFTFEEFASLTASPNPWYQAMVEDMQSKSFLYVGTRLNDPPFYHYLEMRSERSRGVKEVRAKAFLVSPTVTHIRKRQLEDRGFAVIEASTEEFFGVVGSLLEKRVPNRLELLKNRYPHQIPALTSGIFETQAEVLRQFEMVSVGSAGPTRTPPSAVFFEGAEPSWDDIGKNIDAQREVTPGFLKALKHAAEGICSFIVVGHAGSGKSTLLRRLAFELVRQGLTVYFSKSSSKIEKKPVVNLITALGDRHIFIFVDDAIIHLEAVEEIAKELPAVAHVTFVLADRPHVIYPRLRALRALKPTILDMPYLNQHDCERIIEKLEEFGLLGELRNKPKEEQLRAFLVRSQKQLLVAMKEATSGKGFDVILANEFQSLSGENARLSYTITCLAYMHGAPVRRRHLLACLQGTDVQKATLLEEDLREVVVRWDDSQDLVSPRHRIIAKQVATETAPFKLKFSAALSFLTQLSADITPQNISKRTPEFAAYRGIINFDNVLQVFGEDYETIHSLYGELKSSYSWDFLFWLQFGRAQVYFDKFSLAENYLKQSLSIRDEGNFQAHHQMGVLFLKRARFQENVAVAAADASQGETILTHQIAGRGNIDPYPYAALIVHKVRYLKHWNPPKKEQQIEELFHLARVAMQKHPFDDAVKQAHDEILREYLMLAVPSEYKVSATTNAEAGSTES